MGHMICVWGAEVILSQIFRWINFFVHSKAAIMNPDSKVERSFEYFKPVHPAVQDRDVMLHEEASSWRLPDLVADLAWEPIAFISLGMFLCTPYRTHGHRKKQLYAGTLRDNSGQRSFFGPK